MTSWMNGMLIYKNDFISGFKQLTRLIKISGKKSVTKKPSVSLLEPFRKYQKYIAHIMLASYLSMPGALLAQGVTAANTANAPSFDTAPNGVPIVNINAPSSAGVSRNEYNDLNVESKGLIFNNSTGIVSTQLAGYIDGNSRLNGKNASVILNEVLGNSRSDLNGYMEIAGKAAQMVIANQNGISCNGCGFINTPRGTLTTGKSVFDASGHLSGFDVSQGHIDIAGAGLNGSNIDEVDLLARSVSLNGKFWAKNADIVTGQNHINYSDKSTSPLANGTSGTKPEFSLDVAAIGGMYANRIRLIGTEKGLGVNLRGDVSASQTMTLDTQGNLINKASLSASQLSVKSQLIDNQGAILGDQVTLSTNQLDNSGNAAKIQASNTLTTNVAAVLNNVNGAKIQANMGSAIINADTLNNQSAISAKQLTLNARDLNNQTSNGIIYGADSVNAKLTGQLTNTNSALLQSDGTLTVSASGNLQNDSTIAASGVATLSSDNLTNTGTIFAQNDTLSLTANQLVDNSGAIQGIGLNITADSLDNHSSNGKLLSSKSLAITTTGSIVNRDNALIYGDGNVTLKSANGDLINSSTIESTTQSSIDSQNITNSGTVLAQTGDLVLHTQMLNNTGLLGGYNLNVQINELTNTGSSGQLFAMNNLALNAAGSVANTNGALVHADNDLTLTATGDLNNTGSKVEALSDATISSRDLMNDAGAMLSSQNGTLSIQTGSLNNYGGVTGNNSNIRASGISNIGTSGLIVAKQNLDARSSGNFNNLDGGVFYSFGNGYLQANETLTNSSARIESVGRLSIIANSILNKRTTVNFLSNKAESNFYDVGEKVIVEYGGSNSPTVSEQTIKDYKRTVVTPYFVGSSAGKILSSGDISIEGSISNLYSIISASGSLIYKGSLNNQALIRNMVTTESGTDDYIRYYSSYEQEHGGRVGGSHLVSGYVKESVTPFSNRSTTPLVLLSSIFSGANSITGSGGNFDNIGDLNTFVDTSLQEKSDKSFSNALNSEDLNTRNFLSTLNNRRDQIFNANTANDLISSALFKINSVPNQTYLVETNPLLTSYKIFISSDYLLNKTSVDSVGHTGNMAVRLGDGYLEQTLVRDQIIAFTGQQSLSNEYIEQSYKSLMDNAVGQYQSLNLIQGVELTTAQIEKLNKPIVWMVTEAVQTADGLQNVLVPKVYMSQSSGFIIRPDGAVVSASDINIQSDGDINNSGTMFAKVDLSLKSSNINNRGVISSDGSASLTASQNITNTYTIQSMQNLNLTAGGNITNETLVHHQAIDRGSYTESKIQVGNVATLKGGSVQLVAGNDIAIKGSEIKSSGDLALAAGNDLSLNSLTETSTRSQDDRKHITSAYKTQSTATQYVSSLSGNNIQISAGRNIRSESAQIAAAKDLALSAKDVNLLAAKNVSDEYSFVGSNNNHTETKSHTESLTGTSINAGGALNITAQNDILSKASTLTGEKSVGLTAGGNVTLASDSAYQSDFNEVKKKSSGFFGSKSSTTTTTSESLKNQGTQIASSGNVKISSGSDLLLSASNVKAGGDVSLQAKGSIDLLSAVDQNASRTQRQSKGIFKVSASDRGFNTQTAVESSVTGDGNVSLDSGQNIILQGATLAAQDTLSMGTQAVTKDANGDYVNLDGDKVGNVNITTQALQNKSWDKSSSGFRGIFKDIAKGLVVAASTIGASATINIGHADATNTQTTTQQASNLTTNTLNINADNAINIIGSNVSATGDATLSAANVRIDATKEQSVNSESHTEMSVSSQGPSLQKDQVSLVSVTDTDKTHKTTTTSTTWAGSNISAGNLTIKAKDQAAIIASNVDATGNADIQAKNVLVGGREATSTTKQEDITKTKTMTVGVKNAYVDAALALKALKEAKDAVTKAKHAYDDAKQKVAEGKILEDDLKYYKANIAAATANVANATLAVAASGSAAAAAAGSSAGTGFYATAGVSTQKDVSSTTTSSAQWNGSNINVGGNASVNADNHLNIQGSNINTSGVLAFNGKDISITAGENTNQQSSQSYSEGASVSYSGSYNQLDPNGITYSVNSSNSQSDSQSVDHVNSQITSGILTSNSDSLALRGANVDANKVDINTHDLTVASLQNTSSSTSSSQGGSVGVGAEVNISGNTTQSNANRAWVDNQTSLTGSSVKITAKDTTLTGAVIAAEDANGQDNGQLNFTTDTLTASNLADTDTSKTQGASLGLSKNSTNIGGNYSGYDKAQTTKATIGNGVVTAGGQSLASQTDLSNVNREVSNSQEVTKDLELGGLDANVTIDNRIFTEEGRKSIANDFEQSKELIGDGANAIGMKGITKLLYNIDDPKIAAQLKGKEEIALDALIDAGVDPKTAKAIISNPKLYMAAADILGNGKAISEGKGLSRQKSVSSSQPTVYRGESGQTVIEVTAGHHNNAAESVLLEAKKAKDFVSSLPTDQANAAMLALKVMTGGVIKAAIGVAKDSIVNEALDDKINAVKNTVASAAAAGAQGISLDEQEQRVQAVGENGHSAYLQDGAGFGLDVLGLSAGAGLIKKAVSGKGVEKAGDAEGSLGGDSPYVGGAHKETSRPVGDSLDSHHCPAKACYKNAPISSQDGPAIKMDPGDHRQTASYGGSPEAKAYRKQQKELIDQGKVHEAVQMDIDDLRSKFGNKYDSAIKEMESYLNTLNPQDFINNDKN